MKRKSPRKLKEMLLVRSSRVTFLKSLEETINKVSQ
jgi:hypothetical protein